jgi:hypothetical protein
MFYLSAHKKEVNIAVVINNFESYRLAKKINTRRLKVNLKSGEVGIESKGSCYGEKEQTLPRQTAKKIAPEVEESFNFAA